MGIMASLLRMTPPSRSSSHTAALNPAPPLICSLIFSSRSMLYRNQFSDAQYFTGLVRQYMVNDGIASYQVSHTGHSLGAVLAELSAQTDNTSAVTFDSPGSQSIQIPRPYPNAPIITYLDPPNAINTLNAHSGTMILLDSNWWLLRDQYFLQPTFAKALANVLLTGSPFSVFAAAANYVPYTLASHSLGRIITEFEPTTGEPKTPVPITQNDWPIGVFAGFANYLFPNPPAGSALAQLRQNLIAAVSDGEFINTLKQYIYHVGSNIEVIQAFAANKWRRLMSAKAR